MYITSIARVHITPCRKRKQCESISVKLQQPFYEFEQSGFVNFTATITMSETLKKFKRFKVRVEFMGKTFQFKLSMKKPFYIVKYESFLTFNSIIELKFE